MKLKWIVVSGLMIVALVATACATLVKPAETAHGAAQVATPDVPVAPHEAHKTFDPVLPPASTETNREIVLRVKDTVSEIAPNVPVDVWT